MRRLGNVRANHDHDPRPSSPSMETDGWRSWLARGAATHLSSHAGHPGQRRATQQEQVRPQIWPTASKRVSSPPVGTIPSTADITDEANHNSKPLKSSATRSRATSGSRLMTKAELSTALVLWAVGAFGGGGGERRSSLYCLLSDRTKATLEAGSGAQVEKGWSRGQTKTELSTEQKSRPNRAAFPSRSMSTMLT